MVVATYSNFQVSSNHHQGHSKVQISFNFSFSQNNAKIYNSFKRIIRRKVIIKETSGWRHLKEKNKLFLSCKYQKLYTPSPKMAQLSGNVSSQKWKSLILYFSPTFQEVELRNSTFFQWWGKLFLTVETGDWNCKTLYFLFSWYNTPDIIKQQFRILWSKHLFLWKIHGGRAHSHIVQKGIYYS